MHRVASPSVTGELLKWKVIVALPLLNTNEFAGVPFTVKSVACTVARIHRVTQVDDKVRWLRVDDAIAGRVAGGYSKTDQLSIGEGVLLGWPLITLRPSVHEVHVLGEQRGAVVVVARVID